MIKELILGLFTNKKNKLENKIVQSELYWEGLRVTVINKINNNNNAIINYEAKCKVLRDKIAKLNTKIIMIENDLAALDPDTNKALDLYSIYNKEVNKFNSITKEIKDINKSISKLKETQLSLNESLSIVTDKIKYSIVKDSDSDYIINEIALSSARYDLLHDNINSDTNYEDSAIKETINNIDALRKERESKLNNL